MGTVELTGFGNDKEESFGAVLGDSGDEVADDASVDFEEIIAGHTWFAW